MSSHVDPLLSVWSIYSVINEFSENNYKLLTLNYICNCNSTAKGPMVSKYNRIQLVGLREAYDEVFWLWFWHIRSWRSFTFLRHSLFRLPYSFTVWSDREEQTWGILSRKAAAGAQEMWAGQRRTLGKGAVYSRCVGELGGKGSLGGISFKISLHTKWVCYSDTLLVGRVRLCFLSVSDHAARWSKWWFPSSGKSSKPLTPALYYNWKGREHHLSNI